MNRIRPKHDRVLAVAPSTKGFGFCVLEGLETLVDWGVKSVKGDKNSQCVAKLEKMFAHYEPSVLVLEDHAAKGSRRSPRICMLGKEFAALAARHSVKVKLFSRDQVKRTFFADGAGTQHD